MGKITESSRSRREKQKLFSQARMIAVRSAQSRGLPLTYASDDKVVREYPDGHIEIIGVITPSSKKIPKKFMIK